MADWDSADLLARLRTLLNRPAADELVTDVVGYALLSDAQVYWHGQFSTHCPWLLYSAPTLMVTDDDGKTYRFANNIVPSKIEVYESLNGRKLIPGAYWSPGADYVWEGARIRFPLNGTRAFGDGPYGRYIVPPTKIDAATPPVLVPDWCRILLPPRGAIFWAERGGLRDSKPYEKVENDLWYGEPQRGKFGILVTLKTQNPDAGAAAIRREGTLVGLSYLAGGPWR